MYIRSVSGRNVIADQMSSPIPMIGEMKTICGGPTDWAHTHTHTASASSFRHFYGRRRWKREREMFFYPLFFFISNGKKEAAAYKDEEEARTISLYSPTGLLKTYSKSSSNEWWLNFHPLQHHHRRRSHMKM